MRVITLSIFSPMRRSNGPAASKVTRVISITTVIAASTIETWTGVSARDTHSIALAIDPGPAIIGMAPGGAFATSGFRDRFAHSRVARRPRIRSARVAPRDRFLDVNRLHQHLVEWSDDGPLVALLGKTPMERFIAGLLAQPPDNETRQFVAELAANWRHALQNREAPLAPRWNNAGCARSERSTVAA